ncbi:hypothetical protein GH714_032874 [Hevea brasiliensis]|uniref:XS domain-containing protein n=1 Tax=Hevea brasiliensis TaxID=3981 RepID=A0A6A6NE24_HEVBR|nr:hypothetical protein GH714_032874 [Hevea brasiliensis]
MPTSGTSAKPSVHVERGESSMGFCENCLGKKENDQLIKNGNCRHPICLECISKHVEAKIKLGMKTFTCPGLNCECVLQLETFKNVLSKDVLNLWEKALSTKLVPKRTCRKGLYAKTGSENGNGKHFTAGTSKILSPPEVKKIVQFSHHIAGTNDSAEADNEQIVPKRNRENEGTKSASSSLKDMPAIFDDIPPMGQRLNRQHSNGSSPWKGSGEGQEKVADDVEKFETAFSGAATAADTDHGSDSDTLPDTDDYDSEASPRSPESCKKSKWFKKFLEGLEYLSVEETNDPARQWHCPACQYGAGAIKQYLGLQNLIKHAKTKGSTRVRLHQELAQLLEEKLRQATSAALGGEACGKWKGLKEEKKDHEIVWPPMVIITNTVHKKNEYNKWIGMTTQQLLDMFSTDDAVVKVQHFYNSNGHCGREEGTGRKAWNSRPVYFLPSGERQLYGYMAVKEDVDTFNQYYSKGKPKLKYEMRSYQEMVVNRIRQMSKDNLQLPWLQNRVVEQQNHAKDLEESNGMLKVKLNNVTRDMEILRRKAKQQHEQDTEEMESLEQFYKDQIKTILEARKENDGDFENTQQKEVQENAEQSNANSSN